VLRQGEDVFLDDLRLDQVRGALPVPIRIVQGADDIVAACLGASWELP
jgi:hypothetical protein